MLTIERFTDRYEFAAPLYGRSPDELRDQDRRQAEPLQRWLAMRDGEAVGAVRPWKRADDRLFLHFACHEMSAYPPLLEMIDREFGRPVFTHVDAGDRDLVDLFTEADFRTEMTSERFRVRFDRALALVKRGQVSPGFSIRPANGVDEDRLFALDNLLRRDMQGTEGWRGDRRMFREEIVESPPFDPASYLVGIDERSGDYAGLVRIWRNPDGPRFGLVGVLPRYRRTPLAAALLNQALSAAARWGYETFLGETSLDNEVTHPRLKRLGAESLGQFLQLVRH